MGDIWLPDDFPQRLQKLGGKVRVWDGWQNRSASQGGFKSKSGVVNHHTASPEHAHGYDDWHYACFNDTNGPEYNIGIDPDGTINVLAAGGVNSSGAGGPIQLGNSIIPEDDCNYRLMAVSWGNKGDGTEIYTSESIEAGAIANAAYLAWAGLNTDYVTCHKYWCGPQTTQPGRKVDPYGHWEGGGDWGPQQSLDNISEFRKIVDNILTGNGDDDMPLTDEDVQKVAKAVWNHQIDMGSAPDEGTRPAHWLIRQCHGMARYYLGGWKEENDLPPDGTLLKRIWDKVK